MKDEEESVAMRKRDGKGTEGNRGDSTERRNRSMIL